MESTESHPWHPKVTPYRLLVIFTTISLGTAKAYAVSRDLFLVATSVEWVTSVIIFSILFILGLYEPHPHPPHLLKWLLSPDLVHIFFRMFSLSPPNYRSDELKEHLNVHQYTHSNGLRLPVTGYRLLTCVSVSLFGILKAYFAYQNDSQPAKALDWVAGIIITSFLYVLGLYENNSVDLMPFLFSVEYFAVSYYTLWLAIHMIGISLSWFATRWLWVFVCDLRVPVTTAFGSADVLILFGVFVFFIGWFLLAPFSFIILCSRVLDKSWNDPPVRIARKILRTIFSSIWIHLPFGVLPWWIRNLWSFKVIKILYRIRENGIWMFGCLAGSVVFAGCTLLSLGALYSTSTSEGISVPWKLFMILSLTPSILCTFGLSAVCLVTFVSYVD